jgi:hypothetical protein
MFCPKCGNKLVHLRKNLYCEKGNMQFSESLTNRFNECFGIKTSHPIEIKFSFLCGGTWFCPQDRTKMTEENGFIKCKKCQISLNEFIRTLVETHPHK